MLAQSLSCVRPYGLAHQSPVYGIKDTAWFCHHRYLPCASPLLSCEFFSLHCHIFNDFLKLKTLLQVTGREELSKDRDKPCYVHEWENLVSLSILREGQATNSNFWRLILLALFSIGHHCWVLGPLGAVFPSAPGFMQRAQSGPL